jgi:hypothetical protein
MSDKMETGGINDSSGQAVDNGGGHYDDNESEEIDPGNDNLQIDESEDVDVTEPDNKVMRMDTQSDQCCNNEGKGAIYIFVSTFCSIYSHTYALIDPLWTPYRPHKKL